ncbi:MAG: BRCT domain-containing protein, partial [Myxococcales bacterium]|nr:BRCT domain-containing protein [Myxococcales bacterium]
MSSMLTVAAVQQAREARDPDLAQRIVALAQAHDVRPDGPVREGATDFWTFRRQSLDRTFLRGKAEERKAFRLRQWAVLEAPDAEVALPERLGLHTVILDLWQADDAYSRAQLLETIATVPLRWGPWRALKRIFKEAEERQDYEVFGALAARIDAARAGGRTDKEIGLRTLTYLVRRAWRTLRRIGEALPAVYPDAAVEILRCYPEDTNWRNAWIANHIFYHAAGQYSRTRFRFRQRPSTLLKHRAFADLWRRTPRPLFNLLERARSEQARRFATDALRSDFRTSLRTVEPAWVERLVHVDSSVVHDFVIWLLDNVPRFEQAAFHELGLHEPVLLLLDSPSSAARAWAAEYARTHARDLALERLVLLANNDHEAVRKMAQDLLRARHPRDAVGLEAWGRLLGTRHAHDLAAKALRDHFTARELTPAWFMARLLSADGQVVAFASELLPRIHPDARLGAAWYRDLLDQPEIRRQAADFALDRLERFPADQAFDVEFVRRALLNPASARRARGWIQEERVKAETLGADWLKVVADERTWAADAWVAELRASGRLWARELTFDGTLAGLALSQLADVRRFTPDQIGFAWLMDLVQRTEPREHDFAVEYMTKAFVPADFAPPSEDAGPADAGSGEINVDLGGASFLFTGKLATMTRSQAEGKVTAAHGTNAGAVTKNLDYLVIGDEGSPLYGAGRKGSKQVKAEQLVSQGAALRIISETAFLQMLAGKTRKADDNQSEAGLLALWGMITQAGPADAPLARFARHYVRRHHEEICPAETDRYVDPGAEIPKSFLTFERIDGLLADERAPVRALGVELARYELARLKPPMDALVRLSELPYEEVRAFVTEALTAEESAETKRFRVDPATLTADAVYRFCESMDANARHLGMLLIQQNARLAIPEELFRLTESPDRTMQAFVVRQLWRLYRARGRTESWQPPPPDPKRALPNA